MAGAFSLLNWSTSSFLPLLWWPLPCKAGFHIAKLQLYTLSSRYATAVLLVRAVTPQTPTSGTLCRTFLMSPSLLSPLRAWL